MSSSDFDKNVFINCPLDIEYEPIRQAILYCLIRLGFKPRIATERTDSAETRLEEFKDSIHEATRPVDHSDILGHRQVEITPRYADLVCDEIRNTIGRVAAGIVEHFLQAFQRLPHLRPGQRVGQVAWESHPSPSAPSLLSALTTASGSRSITVSKTRAALSGTRRTCSHS